MTSRYSTSFTLGIKVFPRGYQEPIYAIYGFVRLADEIVDTFLNEDRAGMFEAFKDDVRQAIDHKISANPLLHSFQSVVHAYQINREYIDAFFDSMEMDLGTRTYSRESFDKYVYGSAEAVGLMCLKVFCHGREELFDELAAPARKLGAAFQKINFLRDIKSDLELRGRIYLPGVKDRKGITLEAKRKMEKEIEEELSAALRGMRRLPENVRLANYSVYLYYCVLFNELKKRDIAALLSGRVRVPDLLKWWLFIRAYFTVKFFWRKSR